MPSLLIGVFLCVLIVNISCNFFVNRNNFLINSIDTSIGTVQFRKIDQIKKFFKFNATNSFDVGILFDVSKQRRQRVTVIGSTIVIELKFIVCIATFASIKLHLSQKQIETFSRSLPHVFRCIWKRRLEKTEKSFFLFRPRHNKNMWKKVSFQPNLLCCICDNPALPPKFK